MTIKLLVFQGTPVKPENWKEMVAAQLEGRPIPDPVYDEDRKSSNWKYSITDHGFTDGGNRLPAPTFSSSRNPTCQLCGHRQRSWADGPPPCFCDHPEFDDAEHTAADRKAFQDWCVQWLKECFRVLKPGGIIKVFGGTRMFHRMAAAMEAAGFVLPPDALEGWGYGQGFPKSLNISKAIDKMHGAEREVVGSKLGLPGYSLADNGRTNKVYGDLHNPSAECEITVPATEDAKKFEGRGTALKPAWEPFVVGRKPAV